MEILTLVYTLVLLLAVECKATSIEILEGIPPSSETKTLRKREVGRRNKIDEFIEEKLVQQSQALEHIMKIVQKNEEILNKLVENISKSVEQPKLPDKVEFTRRSFDNNSDKVTASDTKTNTWCALSLLCTSSRESVCGYDEKYGHGKFEDICHLMRVNCYWHYEFSLVECKLQL